MNYTKNLYIPANTPESNPVKEQIIIREKVITRIDITIDTVATKGLVGVKIFGGKAGFRTFSHPTNAEEWIRKSDTWTGRIELSDPYLPIDILGISPSTGLQHLAIISIQTEP